MKENQDPFPKRPVSVLQCVFSQTKEKKNQRNQNAIKNHFQIPRDTILTSQEVKNQIEPEPLWTIQRHERKCSQGNFRSKETQRF